MEGMDEWVRSLIHIEVLFVPFFPSLFIIVVVVVVKEEEWRIVASKSNDENLF